MLIPNSILNSLFNNHYWLDGGFMERCDRPMGVTARSPVGGGRVFPDYFIKNTSVPVQLAESKFSVYKNSIYYRLASWMQCSRVHQASRPTILQCTQEPRWCRVAQAFVHNLQVKADEKAFPKRKIRQHDWLNLCSLFMWAELTLPKL